MPTPFCNKGQDGDPMRKIFAFTAITVALCVYAAFTAASGLAIGGIHLAGDIDISDDQVELTNGAMLALSGTPWKCQICGKTAEDALITAKTIKADLKKTPEKKMVLGKAVATSGVVIHVKQVDKAKKVTRFIHASADKAVFTPAATSTDDETIVLTGNAAVKVVDPDLDKPLTTTGSTITVYLNKNKVNVKGGDMRIPKPEEEAQQ